MRQEDRQAINEIRDMIKVLIEENERLANTINELKEEQKKLQEEIKIQNIVLNSLPFLDKIGFNVINQKYLIGSAGIDIPLFPLRIKFARQEGLELAEEAGRVFGEQVLTH